jgi:hypothetical protein
MPDAEDHTPDGETELENMRDEGLEVRAFDRIMERNVFASQARILVIRSFLVEYRRFLREGVPADSKTRAVE